VKADYRANIARLNDMFPGKSMLTVDEVAEWLSVNRKTVTSLIVRKVNPLPAVNVGATSRYKSYRVSVEALAKFSS
jgi:excisionase family DNA binding protein